MSLLKHSAGPPAEPLVQKKQDDAAILSVSQLRGSFYLRADGFNVPNTAFVSKRSYSQYLQFCEKMIKDRFERSFPAQPAKVPESK